MCGITLFRLGRRLWCLLGRLLRRCRRLRRGRRLLLRFLAALYGLALSTFTRLLWHRNHLLPCVEFAIGLHLPTCRAKRKELGLCCSQRPPTRSASCGNSIAPCVRARIGRMTDSCLGQMSRVSCCPRCRILCRQPAWNVVISTAGRNLVIPWMGLVLDESPTPPPNVPPRQAHGHFLNLP